MTNPGVYPVTILNQKGMSLLEVLVGFSTLLIIVTIFPPMLLHWTYSSPDMDQFTYEEYSLFLMQLQTEFRKSDDYWVSEKNDKLYMVRSDDEYLVHFEHYQDKIRRQVRGVGHEVFMQRVTNFRVYERSYGIEIELTYPKGTLNWSIHHPSTSTEYSSSDRQGRLGG
ncbi:ComGF family competence protein [Salipaludibacillus keqinensis]|uniref:ComGF family competence protein n=1 Tax=Salipaludibacillus keqinensis TaxID=2045207 RepID=UPI001304800E|nr:ComGF family competence protein [Salipaludibacillus keqinensis]